jgi:flagellar hook-associated protein 2
MATSVDSLYNSSSRITSLFSDLDTDQMVKDLCSGQQTKIDRQYQKKTEYEWKQTAWTDISDAVDEFSESYCSVLGSTSMLKNSTYVAYSVNTADTSGAVKLTATSAATASNIKVSVSKIAKNASVSGSTGVSGGAADGISASNTTTLAELKFANPLQFTDGNISFAINGKTFSFSSDTTLQSMINTVNSDNDANVTMKYSRLTDSFTLTADSGGKNSSVTVENISGNAFGENSAFGIAEGTVQNGQDAELTINDGTSESGVSLTKDSNNFTIDGITYDITDTTSGEVSFNIERDYSTTVDAISKFVDALNTLMKKVGSYSNAKDYSEDYPALTEAQKEDMTDEQIEKWEDKAKNGILRHDSTLEALVTNLKSAFYTSAGGTGKNASSLGISTGSYFSSSAGLLEIDEDALKTALASNPEEVISIFTGGTSSAESSQQGVIYKLKSAIKTFSSTSSDTLTDLSDDIDDTKENIDTLTDKLSDMSERYYEKFSNMETALSKLNSSANMISSMFS